MNRDIFRLHLSLGSIILKLKNTPFYKNCNAPYYHQKNLYLESYLMTIHVLISITHDSKNILCIVISALLEYIFVILY